MAIAPNISDPWISPRNRVPDSRLRLFCLPHAGSGIAAYHLWKRTLPSFVELCPIQLPGREVRIAEAPLPNLAALVNQMADAVTPWLDKPYAIFGHSMGALLAYELAQTLRARGLPAPLHLFVSGRIAAHLDLPGRPIHQLPAPEFLAELGARYEGLPDELLNDPEMLELFLPILRADITVIETYRFPHGDPSRGPLPCPITAFSGASDKSVSYESLLAWQRHTSAAFDAHRLPGGHFYLWNESRAALLDQLCVRLLALDPATATTAGLHAAPVAG
jgi:medium-chain acyl-[acyl-carrier-protein] hydrolase